MKGIRLINSVIFKFTKLISQLERGIELINAEQNNNDDAISGCYITITNLEDRNFELDTPKKTAQNVITNLKKLLGETDG